MEQINQKNSFFKNYGFLICMIIGIVAGCIVGATWPGATALEPIGTIFINMMFCVVVPMVFVSISSAIANMKSARRAGKVMGTTIATFCVTAAIAALIMYIIARCIPLVVGDYPTAEGEIGETLGVADMIVNFFTKPDFTELFSRRAILPLIVAAVLFGFGIQLNGGPKTKTAQMLEDLNGCLMKVVKIITYYAPIGFFGFFAYLVASYGPELIGDYGRTLIIYYVLCFAYMFAFFPIYARFGGGKGAVKMMFSKLFRPAAVRASWFCAPSSSRISWPLLTRLLLPSATSWIPLQRWSTLPATMWRATSFPVLWMEKTGCRKSFIGPVLAELYRTENGIYRRGNTPRRCFFAVSRVPSSMV